MHSSAIYLIHDNGNLVEMTEQPYNSEDVLQHFLATHPNLLAGDQIDTTSPRRWLLVTREATIPDEQGGMGRWALDHLLLDQDAVPTFVEVKRSSDTRIRREVVGQMLDYAANAVVYWSVETIQAQFEANCAAMSRDPEQTLLDFLDSTMEAETFWQQVKTNLQAGKVRLLFVADEIPTELRRVVEFLNQQMNPAEVLAVEIKQFVGQGLRTLVPRVIGQTIAAQQTKQGTSKTGKQWDEASFFQDVAERQGAVGVRINRAIYDWARTTVSRVWWGKGASYGSFVPILTHKRKDHPLFALFSTGALEVYFYWYMRKPPFDAEEKRLELRDKLNAIPGIDIPLDGINRRPSFPVSTLREQPQLEQLIDVLNWIVNEIRAS